MRTTWLLQAAVVALLAVAGRADEEQVVLPAKPALDEWTTVPVVALRDAVASHKVEATGSNPRSYQAVTLALRNPTAERVAVDIAGSYLRPRTPGCQRLGIGPAVTPSATIKRDGKSAVVQLEPGDERVLVVNTCCLDLGLPAPDAQTFVASVERLPPCREKVLRWWAENPQTPQGDVNQAIWTNRSRVHIDPKSAAPARPKSLSAKVRGDDYYELVEGELTRLEPDGVPRLLGSGVRQVFPTDDGVYSVMPGDEGGGALWRLEMTGERCWSRVADLADKEYVHDVLPVGRAGLVLVTDRGVDLVDAGTHSRTRLVPADAGMRCSVRRAGDDRVTIATRRPAETGTVVGGRAQGQSQSVFELWSLSLATGRAERVRELWNTPTLVAGPAGTFALTPAQGNLRRLVGRTLEDFGPNASYGRLVAVATDVLWMGDEGGRLLAVDAATGRVRFRTDVPLSAAGAADVDPKTGDLAYVRGEEFRVIRGVDGHEEAPHRSAPKQTCDDADGR